MASRPAPNYPASLINLDAEGELIGGILCNNELLHGVLEQVDIEDFAAVLHQRILYEASGLIAEGKIANPVTLRPLLSGDALLEAAGGPGYLARICESTLCMSPRFAMDFARQIADLAARRRLLDEMRAQTEAIADVGSAKVAEVASSIDIAIAKAVARRQVGTTATLSEAVETTWKAIEEEVAGKRRRGVETAFIPDWNTLTGTMRPGEMIVLGALPSMGKTATATSISLGAAMNGHGVLFVSLEMDRESMTERMIADLLYWEGATTTYTDVQNGNIAMHDLDRWARVRDKIKSWPLIITDPPRLTSARLPMLVRRYQREMEARGQTLELVVIDYLQLMEGAPKQQRYEVVTEASRTIKATTKECGVTILALSQLSRAITNREDKRPTLADLRESGQIEQDADVVAFLHREEWYLDRMSKPPEGAKRVAWEEAKDAARGRIDIIIAKRRKGRIDERSCHFIGEHQAVRGSRHFQDKWKGAL